VQPRKVALLISAASISLATDVLEAGALGAAGLDMFDKEPDVPAAPLNSDRVVLLPHRAVQRSRLERR
jgi:phosphoglycerate dehydrogenase-like enzyme